MIESALKQALETLTGMDAYPLLLPDPEQEGVTFQRISDPAVDTGMVRTRLIAGRFQICIYKIDDYTGLLQLDYQLWSAWRDIRHGNIGGFPVQYVERGNIRQDKTTMPNNRIQYRLVRDFIFYFNEGGS